MVVILLAFVSSQIEETKSIFRHETPVALHAAGRAFSKAIYISIGSTVILTKPQAK